MAPHASIRHALTAVTASLIGASAVQGAGPSSTETSILFYSERDRSRATEATFNWTKALKNRFNLNLRLTFDALTGSTPTGASPSKYAQTVTRPSGGQTILVPAEAHPVDESFNDTRISAEVGLTRPLFRYTTGQAGVRYSGEHDYKSLGLNAGLTQELFTRNTSIGISAAYAKDVISPVGGYYEAFSEVGTLGNETPEERRARFEGRAKRVYDYVISLAQVIDRKTVVRVNWTGTHATGYLTDPYKVVSLVQSPDSTDPGEPVTSLYENRPTSRHQNAVMGQLRRQLWGIATDFSYRYFWDDWNVRSHTVGAAFHLNFRSKGVISPRVRWYRQSAASFHMPFLVQDEALPLYSSADSRLAAFHGLTFGLGYSFPINPASRLSFGAEYYMQRGDVAAPDALSSDVTFDLFPRLDVIMIRMGYAHEFF